MIAIVDDHRDAHGFEPICRVLPIAPLTYRPRAAQQQNSKHLSVRRPRHDVVLKPEIARVRRELRGLRRAQGLAADDTEVRARRPLYGHATDARNELGRSDPRQAGAHHDQQQGGAAPYPLDQVNHFLSLPKGLRTGAEHAVALSLHAPRGQALAATCIGIVYVAPSTGSGPASSTIPMVAELSAG